MTTLGWAREPTGRAPARCDDGVDDEAADQSSSDFEF
jgi:hypothetical protein